eukprot:1854714-Prymnesium_polylepis.1
MLSECTPGMYPRNVPISPISGYASRGAGEPTPRRPRVSRGRSGRLGEARGGSGWLGMARNGSGPSG